MALDRVALRIDREVGLGHRAGVVGTEPAVVVDPVRAYLALEVPVRPRAVRAERGDRRVEVPAADPCELGDRPRHEVGREVLEDLERGHELERVVLPGQAREQVRLADVAGRTRNRVGDRVPAEVTAGRVDPTLAQDLDQVTGRASHVEGVRDPEVAPEQPPRDVGVRRHTVVACIARAPLPVAGRVAALAEVAAHVGVGETSRPQPGGRLALGGCVVEFAPRGPHPPPGRPAGRGQVRHPRPHALHEWAPARTGHGPRLAVADPDTADSGSAGTCAHPAPGRTQKTTISVEIITLRG